MINLSIKSYFLWTPFTSSEVVNNTNPSPKSKTFEIPALDFIDKKKQRRLNELSRLVLYSAVKCTTPQMRNCTTILSSRHGDINSALKVLQDIAHDELISPQMFVNSVLNMPFAYYAIFFSNNLSSSAISSSESSLGYGFLEAVLNLKRFPTNDILLTCADIPLEGDLEKFNDSPYLPYSFSLLISGDESAQNRISFDYEPVSGVEKSGKIPDVL